MKKIFLILFLLSLAQNTACMEKNNEAKNDVRIDIPDNNVKLEYKVDRMKSLLDEIKKELSYIKENQDSLPLKFLFLTFFIGSITSIADLFLTVNR